MATIDLGKIAITPEGKWSAGKYYEKLSLVIFNGQSYLSLRDTTGDNPETSRSDWMQITSRGESLYQMMVREGKFVGTEEEFTQQYLDSLKACADASDEVRSALSDILDEMDRIRAEISEVMVEEDIRIKNEAKRESAEINRKNADITRGVAERNRQEAEQRREQSMQQIQNDAEIALAMAAEAQQKAEEAILNEEERISAENQRKIDEATRIQHEEQRVNDEAMRRSREADRLESENIRQKNEGDRILAEREREETMRNLVEELKGLAANKFKIVDVLPEVGEFAVIYLVPSTRPSDNDVYDEWAYVSEKWEHIGSTRFEIDNYYTKEEIEAALNTKQETLTAGNGISIEGNVISSTVDSLITPTTYAELVALRNSSSLIAGMQYRITDYTCTTTQENTQSAGHPFDIIVTADSENTLNEVARAIQHEGDTYFADCDLNAWKIWYCLDNDATRFAWADSANGKGIIYRMIDEWNNDVPYDFKNIQFARDWSVIAPDSVLAGTIYCYTFSVFLDGLSEDATANDESVKAKECIESDGDGFFGNNKIALRNSGAYLLNDIIFFTDWANYTVNHFSNTFGNYCYSNTFGNSCYSNTFGDYCSSNTFGNDCYYNSFGNSCYSNTLGNACYSNTFGNHCNYIKFAISSSATTKYNYYQHNHFGDGCQYILFKGAETASDSAQVQNYNFAQGLQGTSSAYLTIDGVRSRAYETKVAKNSSGELKIYCEADLIQ